MPRFQIIFRDGDRESTQVGDQSGTPSFDGVEIGPGSVIRFRGWNWLVDSDPKSARMNGEQSFVCSPIPLSADEIDEGACALLTAGQKLLLSGSVKPVVSAVSLVEDALVAAVLAQFGTETAVGPACLDRALLAATVARRQLAETGNDTDAYQILAAALDRLEAPDGQASEARPLALTRADAAISRAWCECLLADILTRKGAATRSLGRAARIERTKVAIA